MQPFKKETKHVSLCHATFLKKKQSIYNSALQPFKKETKHVSLCHATFLKKKQSIYNSAMRPPPRRGGMGMGFF